jgi:hypothetical protein
VDVGEEGALCLSLDEAALAFFEEAAAGAFLEGDGEFLLATAVEDSVLLWEELAVLHYFKGILLAEET